MLYHKTLYQNIVRMILLAGMCFLCAGCAAERQSTISMDYMPSAANQTDEQKDDKIDVEEITAARGDTADEPIYIVLNVNTEQKLIGLGAADSPRTFQYAYTEGTQVLDKYEDYVAMANLTPGRAVTIGDLDSDGKLTSIHITDRAWYQEEITRFSIDTTIGMIVIGDTKYSYDKNLRVFSDETQISVNQIKQGDIICVQGVEGQIVSIQVEHGQGTIALINTDIFEGGWISLGTRIYAKITPNMMLDVPEGTYLLSVANDGYGDTKEIQVERSQVTTVDLTEYRGNGPKICKVSFEVHVEGARLFVDDKEIDYRRDVELRYGIHQLTVSADGYENWERQLVIHSEETTIQIGEPDMVSETVDAAGEAEETADTNDANAEGETAGEQNEQTPADTQAPDDAQNNDTADQAGTQPGQAAENGQPITVDLTDDNHNSTDTTGSNTTTGTNPGSRDTTGTYTDYLDTIADLIESLRN